MKNFSTGRLGQLFFNAVIPECFYRGSQPLKNTTRLPIMTFGNDVRRVWLSGFTLIELLVVVLIIGILSAIALPQYTLAVEKARATEAVQNIATIEKQVDLYVLENGTSDDTVSYKDFASVALTGGHWEGPDYVTKNFDYFPSSNAYGFGIEVFRTADGIDYTFYSTNYPASHNNDSPVGNWYRACITQTNDLGRKICKQFEGLGWKYLDADM